MSAYSIVKQFEQAIADYAGAPYAVAVSSCTAALFLCCVYKQVGLVRIPEYTYPGVACSVKHAGGKIDFAKKTWQGTYELEPYRIYDSALRFKRGMYVPGSMYCLSFHIKKHLAIGRGGMILLEDEIAYGWLKRARFDGRGEVPLSQDKIGDLGWNEYMTPEQAARGLMLFDMIKDKDLPDLPVEVQGYPNLSEVIAYK